MGLHMERAWQCLVYGEPSEIVALTVTSLWNDRGKVISLLRIPNYPSALSLPLSHLIFYQLCRTGAFIPIL